jgi:Na+/proline symporter
VLVDAIHTRGLRPGKPGAWAKSKVMASSSTLSWARVARQALIAGIAGGFLLDTYLWFTTMFPEHQSVFAMWQLIAAEAVGKFAAQNPNAVWIGLAVHIIVSIGWAGGYAYIASTRPAMRARWLVSGVVYGIIVYMFMQILLLVSGNFEYPHTPNDFVNAVFAHVLFYGIPVAYIVNFLDAR